MPQLMCVECAKSPSYKCDRCNDYICQDHHKPMRNISGDDTVLCVSCHKEWIEKSEEHLRMFILSFSQVEV